MFRLLVFLEEVFANAGGIEMKQVFLSGRRCIGIQSSRLQYRTIR
jgi:hypothetical protein